MKRIALSVVVVTFFLAPLAGSSASAQRGKPPSSIPVTTTVQGLGPDAVPLYRLQSDHLGAYKTGFDSVTSEIQGIGDWLLDTTISPVRKVYIDFRDPVAGTNPNNVPPPFLFEHVSARIISKCSLFSGDLKALRAGNTLACPLSIRFDYAGVGYAVRMNDNFPGTDYAIWTCLSENSSGKCNQYKMEPGGVYDGERKNIAQLVRMITVRNKTTTENIGKYYISFVVDATNP